MSCHVFFAFSRGLSQPMLVPGRTLEACQSHVRWVEQELGFKVEQYLDNPPQWRGADGHWSMRPKYGVGDERYCKVVGRHNDFVRRLYRHFGEWSKATLEAPPKGTWTNEFGDWSVSDWCKQLPPETLTPEDAATFWHGLQTLDVPPERWDRDHYMNRMEHLYEVMRGRESEGVRFDARKLSPKQAGEVIVLFSKFFDHSDCRLDVPNGYDHLATSDDGGYDWCEKCGPAHPDDSRRCRKKACPIREEDGMRYVLRDKATGEYMGRYDKWCETIDRHVRRFDERNDAVAFADKFAERVLVIVPVMPMR